MKFTILLSVLFFLACNANEERTTITKTDTIESNTTTPVVIPEEKQKDSLPAPKTYSNKRFKDVSVERVGKDSFFIRGQGQIFEANFNWVVEDGHEELQKGFQMTDAGAPEWGKFEFSIHAQKKRENSTLTLILFESSAKDGSRQHELPIVLY